jgi:hypothetical protein
MSLNDPWSQPLPWEIVPKNRKDVGSDPRARHARPESDGPNKATLEDWYRRLDELTLSLDLDETDLERDLENIRDEIYSYLKG